MKQMQGLMAQFEVAMKKVIYQDIRKPQDKQSRAKYNSNTVMLQGTKQSTNPTTIAMAIFNTFLSLFARCCSALVDCSPGIFCDLSLITMIE